MLKQKLYSTISLAVAISTISFGLTSSKAFAQCMNYTPDVPPEIQQHPDAVPGSRGLEYEYGSELRDPLIPGASSDIPFIPAPHGKPEAIGSGPVPYPVTSGMPGNPTLERWVPRIPFNSIDQSTTGIGLNAAPSLTAKPGMLGPLLTPVIPGPESTPGAHPRILQAPVGFINPGQIDRVPCDGRLPGTGGYNTSISRLRRSGQHTYEFEHRETDAILGGGGPSQDEVTQFGTLAGWGVPFGVPTGNGYNKGLAGTNNDLRLSAIDLGGGMAVKVGGTVIPLGQTVQDFGKNDMRHNGTLGLTAHRATEFGQGRHGEPINSSKTTDFGFPFHQIPTPNLGVQDRDAGLVPKAIETNF